MPAALSFLIVEDHDFQRNMLVKMLKAFHPKSVHAAADGRAALEIISGLDAPPDVIISDLQMPTMDGMEFVRHLGLAGQGASLIVVSALERGLLASAATIAGTYGLNFLGTIEKPITPRKLEELIARHKPRSARAAPLAARAPSFAIEEILEGLADDEFEPFFQPKIEMATEQVIGAEALARWRHPQQGIVSPAAFIKPLEDAGKIDILMRVMLRKAAEHCRNFNAAGQQGTVAVNVSTKSLTDVRLADQITEIVRSQNLEARLMVLEITESAATTDLGKVLENLARLRMNGFGLSIDDYGTGYSSMEQLTRIPFTELKIDQSFVTHAGREESAKVILGSSLEMARRLNIQAVAEGVETSANWDLLCELKCDIAQGYYISRPMAASSYLDWMRGWPMMK